MSILIVRRGLQGNRGLTGLAAAETITLVNNLTSVVAVAGSIANVNTVVGSIANVNTVAGSIANVNLAGNNIADISLAAANMAAIAAAPSYASTTTVNKNACEAAAAQATAAANGMKYRSVRAASIANLTLSGTQTIDGVTLTAGERVLVKDQSTTAQNGIYIVAAGSWSRASDMDTWGEVVGTLVVVEEGTANGDLTFLCTSNQGGALGSTAVTFTLWQSYIPDGSLSYTKLAATSSAQLASVLSDEKGTGSVLLESILSMVTPGGRLTLTTGLPVQPLDVGGSSIVYYTPYMHDKIPLYNGMDWRIYTFTERSLVLSGLAGNRPQDIFLYDNGGTLTLETAEWQTQNARGAGFSLTKLNSVWVKNGAPTRLYLGTILTDAGGASVTDTQARRGVWNFYNRVTRSLRKDISSPATWTYATAAWRQMNNDANSMVEFVVGHPEDVVHAEMVAEVTNSSATNRKFLFGVALNDNAPPNNGNLGFTAVDVTNATSNSKHVSTTLQLSVYGYNTLQLCERAAGVDTQTVQTNSNTGVALRGWVRA